MNQGVHLTLLMGPFQAAPVPEAVTEALTSVQVTSAVGSQGGFQLHFTYGKSSAFALLATSGFFDPRRRVIVIVTVNDMPHVLMDGIITKQDLTASGAAGKSAFVVTGLDLTAMMDLRDWTGEAFKNESEDQQVSRILKTYVPLGVSAHVVPAKLRATRVAEDKFVKQQGTDYEYVQSLAARTGSVFFLDFGRVPRTSRAYWGPDPARNSSVQPAFSINFDASSNVDSLSFSYDGMVAKKVETKRIDDKSKQLEPVDVPQLGAPGGPISAREPEALKAERYAPPAGATAAETELAVLGILKASSDAVTANGQLDVMRYGHVLKIRELCAVRGADRYYDGLYDVRSVTHDVKRGEYKLSFSLARRGLGSCVPAVAV